MLRRFLDFIVCSLIELGQELLKLDSIGFDAMCISFLILGLHQIREKMSNFTESSLSINE